ncbi:MAG: hypothetical protein DRO43_06445 [Candidatus Hecatellales archaeon]|nr:MAG: hypothetical protein DRO43_06445 [Candidatus Hecatellales archaeon]
MYESACRPHELLGLRLRNVQVDQYGAVTMVDGKTGQRRIRLVQSAPYLQVWINHHPRKDDPDAPLWFTSRHTGMTVGRLETLLTTLAYRAGLKGRIYPYVFRHSRLTELAKYLTESELKTYAGWTQGSRVAQVYVHLSGRDLDRKILKIHGLKPPEEELMPAGEMAPKPCLRCGRQNPADAKFCSQCGLPLTYEAAWEADKVSQKLSELLNRPEILETLAKTLREILVKGEGPYATPPCR